MSFGCRANRKHFPNPTEGGIITPLWELAEASQKTLRVDPELIPIPPLARRVCEVFAIDPLSSIASGFLLITASASDARSIGEASRQAAITCVDIGVVVDGSALVQRSTASGFETWPRPAMDAFTKAFAA